MENRYEKFAEHYYPGKVQINECPLCGNLRWSSTLTKQPNGYSVSSSYDCVQCNNIMMRYPELYVWIQNVVYKQIHNLSNSGE